MKILKLSVLALIVLLSSNIHGQSFKVLPLGVHGGLEESNLSAYLVANDTSKQYIAMDAGTLYSGIKIAMQNHSLPIEAPEKFIQNNIKAYFISHPHLDHVAGLIQNSPADGKKTIYGLASCIEAIDKHYFSWESWANFSDMGEKPKLGKYHLDTLQKDSSIIEPNTGLKITTFQLSHGEPFKSTAFLVTNQSDNSILYLGDTGADTIEHSHSLHHLWENIAPLIISKKLKAIFIEVSFPNSQPDKLLFGHLTPRLLNMELADLKKLTGSKALKNFPIVITHIKPDGNNPTTIKKELLEKNPFQVKWIFPEQGKLLQF